MGKSYSFCLIIKGFPIICKGSDHNFIFLFQQPSNGECDLIVISLASKFIVVNSLYQCTIGIDMVTTYSGICFVAIGESGRGPGIAFAGVAYLSV